MNNNFNNRPLYPESDFPKNNQNQQNSLFGNLFNSMSGKENSLLSMLVGMKSGNLSDIMSKFGEANPLFQTFSSMQRNNKKESQSSPKSIPDDKPIF